MVLTRYMLLGIKIVLPRCMVLDSLMSAPSLVLGQIGPPLDHPTAVIRKLTILTTLP